MTTYARIVGGCAVDVVTQDPTTLFHEDVAAQFIVVPDGTQHGDTLNADGTWTKYVPAPTPAPAAAKPPTVTPPQFKLLMLSYLPQIRALVNTDPQVAAFMSIIDDPRLTEVDLSLQSVQNGIKYCLTQIGQTADQITADMNQILSGKWT